jgi:hypothetical protein
MNQQAMMSEGRYTGNVINGRDGRRVRDEEMKFWR